MRGIDINKKYRVRFNTQDNLYYFEVKKWFKYKCIYTDANHDLIKIKAQVWLYFKFVGQED